MSRSVRSIASLIKALEVAIRDIQNTPQLPSSSIEGGAVEVYDEQGNLVTVVGEQFDGTYGSEVVSGPKPPQPTAPLMQPMPEACEVVWDGNFVGSEVGEEGMLEPDPGITVPMDFSRIEVHCMPEEGLDIEPGPESSTRRGTIESPGGGSVVLSLPEGDHYVRLVAVSKAGVYSDPSDEVRADVTLIEEIHIADLAISGPKIQHEAITAETIAEGAVKAGHIDANAVTADKIAESAIEADKIAQSVRDEIALTAEEKADLAKAEAIAAAEADATSKANSALQQAQQDLSDAEGALQQAIANGDAAAIADAEAKIATAKQEAIDAAALDATDKAAQAMTKANEALTAAQAAQATADGAVHTYYSSTPPWPDGSTRPDEDLGDMWFDTDTGQAYRWTGVEWVVIQDQTVGQALAAAQNAQATADGKISAYYQPSAPLEADDGDLWFDTDADSKVYYRHNGEWIVGSDPKSLADAAEAAAIAQAEAEAQAAYDAAVIEAQAEASAAKQAAIDAAAADASDKDALLEGRSISRGTDLVTNGTGLLGDNTNFPTLTYDSTDAPTGISGSFHGPVGAYTTHRSAEWMPVNPSKTYQISCFARQTGEPGSGRLYMLYESADALGQIIQSAHFKFIAGTTTTLAAPLNPGDTTVQLTDASGWHNGASQHLRRFIFWDYVDPKGKAWGPETYSRNVTGHNTWEQGGISGNTITLRTPYSGPARPAGTSLSCNNGSSSYMYIAWVSDIVGTEWTQKFDFISGTTDPGSGNAVPNGGKYAFPPGTASIRVGWLLNQNPTGASDIAVAGISLSDASAANYAANHITETQITDGAISTPKIQTDAINARVISAGAIGAVAIAAEAIEADKIKAGAVIAGKIAADAVVANNIKADEIGTNHLKANAVTAGKIEAGAIEASHISAGAILADAIAAEAITAEALAVGAVTAEAIYANAVTSEKIDAEAISAGHIAANAIESNHILAGAVDAEAIAANAIQTNHIEAGAVTSEEIEANSVKAQHIDALQINAGHIAAGAIKADKLDANAINGHTITGAVFRTAESGRRLTWDSTNGIRAFNSAGQQRFKVSTDGNLEATNAFLQGTLTTASSGARATLTQWGGWGMLLLNTGHPAEESAAYVGATSEDQNPILTFKGPQNIGRLAASLTLHGQTQTSGSDIQANVHDGTYYWRGSNNYGGHRFISNANPSNPWLQINQDGLGAYLTTPNRFSVLSGTGGTRIMSDGESSLWGASGGSAGVVLLAGGYPTLRTTEENGNPWLFLPQHGSATNTATTLSPNVGLTSGNRLVRISSSRRYKTGIEDLDVPLQSIRSIKVRTYVDRNQFEENGESATGLRRVVGLIAEEVAEDPHLEDRVVSRNADGDIEAVDYDRVGLLAFPWLHDLEARMTALEQENASLRDRIQTLEGGTSA